MILSHLLLSGLSKKWNTCKFLSAFLECDLSSDLCWVQCDNAQSIVWVVQANSSESKEQKLLCSTPLICSISPYSFLLKDLSSRSSTKVVLLCQTNMQDLNADRWDRRTCRCKITVYLGQKTSLLKVQANKGRIRVQTGVKIQADSQNKTMESEQNPKQVTRPDIKKHKGNPGKMTADRSMKKGRLCTETNYNRKQVCGWEERQSNQSERPAPGESGRGTAQSR